jgi:hypothetical protein
MSDNEMSGNEMSGDKMSGDKISDDESTWQRIFVSKIRATVGVLHEAPWRLICDHGTTTDSKPKKLAHRKTT